YPESSTSSRSVAFASMTIFGLRTSTTMLSRDAGVWTTAKRSPRCSGGFVTRRRSVRASVVAGRTSSGGKRLSTGRLRLGSSKRSANFFASLAEPSIERAVRILAIWEAAPSRVRMFVRIRPYRSGAVPTSHLEAAEQHGRQGQPHHEVHERRSGEDGDRLPAGVLGGLDLELQPDGHERQSQRPHLDVLRRVQPRLQHLR